MTPQEAISKLQSMMTNGGSDNEVVHIEADKILLTQVPEEVKSAYEALEDNVRFWYA